MSKGMIAILVIIVCGAFILYYGTKGEQSATPKTTVFICTECGEQFEVKTAEVGKLQKENPDGSGAIICQGCERFSAKKANPCHNPECGKYWLVEQSLEKWGEKYRCPYCGTKAGEKSPS